MHKRYKQVAYFHDFSTSGDIDQYVKDFFPHATAKEHCKQAKKFRDLINAKIEKKYGDDVYVYNQAFYRNVDAGMDEVRETIREIIDEIDMEDLT